MTVETTLAREQYATNGTTGPWSVRFYFLEDDHLQVIYTDEDGAEATLTLNADYTVTGAGDEAGGTVTTTTAYASGGYITILRNVEPLQEVDLIDGDSLPAETLETAFDKLTMLAQQALEVTDRALVFAPSDTSGSTLPAAAARASKLLGFDSDGVLSLSAPTSGSAADLALDLASSANAAEGAGMIGYDPDLAYAAGTVGAKLREQVSLLDFMSTAQIADVLANTKLVDVTAAVQAAFDWAQTNNRALTAPAGGYVVGQLTTYPALTVRGAGRHVTNFWCASGTTGKWISDRGAGAQKLTLTDMAFYGRDEAGLTHIAEFGDVGVQYGTEGNLSRLWFRDAPNAYGLLVDGNVGLLSDITIQSVATGLYAKGSYNQGADIIIVDCSTTSAILSSGQWRGVEVEAPATGSLPISITSPATRIDGLTLSLATGTSFTHAIELDAAVGNEWSVHGLRVILNGTASLTARFKQGSSTWDGVKGENSGQTFTTSLKVGATSAAAAILGILKVVAVIDFPSVSAGSAQTSNVTVTGAVANMPAMIGFPTSGPYTGLQYSAYCSATDTVTVRAYNPTGSAIDPPSQTFVILAFAY